MSVKIEDWLAQTKQEEAGTGVNGDGDVVIGSPESGQNTVITTSNGSEAVKVADDGTVKIGNTAATTPVNEILNVISASGANNQSALPTVNAVINYVADQTATPLEFRDFDTFAAFTAYAVPGISPTIAFVFDSTTFDYTDTNGNSATGLEWMLAVVNDESGTITSTMINNSDSGNLTGSEIAGIIANTADTNFITDADAAKLNLVPTNTTSALNNKVDKEVGKILSSNDFTLAYKNQLDNAPANINTELNNKVGTTDEKYQNLPTNTQALLDLKLAIYSSGVNPVINNPGTGEGRLTMRNTTAPANQKDFVFVARSDGSLDLEARDDAGANVNRWTFDHGGTTDFPSTIRQAGNNVLDVSDSKYQNLPSNTNSELGTKLDASKVTTSISAAAGNVPDAPTIKGYIDTGIADVEAQIGNSAFDGLLQYSDLSTLGFVLQRTDNTFSGGRVSWQNSGTHITNSIYQDQTNNDALVIAGGGANQANVNDLIDIVRIQDSIVEILPIGAPLHVNGDIFAFNSGDMAARHITAVGKFVGEQIRMNNSETDTNWLLYKAAANELNDGVVSAQGRDFTGEALRIKVADNSNQGFVIENGSAENLLEIKGDTGSAIFADDVKVIGNLVDENDVAYMKSNQADLVRLTNGELKERLIIDHDNTPQLLIRTDTNNGEAFIAFGHDNTSMRAGIGYDEQTNDVEIRVGNSSIWSSLAKKFSLNRSSGDAVFENNLQVKGTLTNASGAEYINAATGDFTENITAPMGKLIGNYVGGHASGNQGTLSIGSQVNVGFSGMRIVRAWDGNYNEENLEFWTHDGGSSQANRFQIFASGEARFNHFLEMIAGARITGDLQMYDVNNHIHRFESDTTGIRLRTETNPAAGGAIFSVESSGNSKRLVVPHDGPITTSNAEIIVGTESDGTGGHPVLTPNNIGDLVASYTYTDSFPSLSQADITEWFQRMAHVQFIGVGGGTLNLPQIVGPETTPTSSQVIAGTTIVLTNYNSGSNISLSRFNSGQTFMIDHLGNLQTSATLFFGSKIELQALDVRSYSAISTNWAWGIKGY